MLIIKCSISIFYCLNQRNEAHSFVHSPVSAAPSVTLWLVEHNMYTINGVGITQQYRCANQQQTHPKKVTAHLAVADAVDHLVVFIVEGVCQEAQALQQHRDVTDRLTAGSQVIV